MLTYSLDAKAARFAESDEPPPSGFNERGPRERTSLQRFDRRFAGDGLLGKGIDRHPPRREIVGSDSHALEITPVHAASRRAVEWDGIAVETVQCVTHEKVEFRFHAPCHLLLVHEEGVRDHGETLVHDLPPSTLRTLRRKLSFVPAGHAYHDWQQPRIPGRFTCFYFDPAKMPVHPDAKLMAPLVPRVLFENSVLWDTAVKLIAEIDHGHENRRYCEALGVIVAHELLRIQGCAPRREPPARGGLAVWQQRIVAGYIEEHLAEPISLAGLAKLVRLSSYYFCRAFKQSFGIPPHRYHINRRMERAKLLLADPAQSVTGIGLALGFSETSSFSAAFRHATGITPTEYRRTLG